MATDYQLFVAREIGYTLAVTARWRRSGPGLAAVGVRGICWCDVCFRPGRRVLGTTFVRGRPHAIVAVGFVGTRRHRRRPYWYRRPSSSTSGGCRGGGEAGTGEEVFEAGDKIRPPAVRGSVSPIRGHETVESRPAGETSATSSRVGDGGDGGGEDGGEDGGSGLGGDCSPSVFPDLFELRDRVYRKVDLKLAAVEADMILCSDEVMFIHELAAAGQRARLRDLIRRFHGSCVLLAWPTGWVFTVVDPIRSPRLQKVGGAVVRDGHVCCDVNITPIGVVHDVGSEHTESEFPVILLGDDGFVYLYDDGGVGPVLYLLTKNGFAEFCRRGLRERAVTDRDVTSTPVDYGEEPFKSLLECRHSLDELVGARDRLLGTEAAVFHTDNVWTFLRISRLDDLGYGQEEFERWTVQSGHLRLEPMFTVKAYVDGVWVDSPVLISEAGTLFYVDRVNSRIRFLASDLYTFLVLGLVRYRSNSFYLRGAFPASRGEANRRKRDLTRQRNQTRAHAGARRGGPSGAVAEKTAYCPRGPRCLRGGARRTWTGRAWRWLCGKWGWMVGCCRG
ncbi:pR43 [rat cytomegalovirus strain Maastricht]|uniref:PR43 n=1 Tax=Rat cytomegalovirus (strain Maastricht) TaxID=79700 RepID=Q9DWE8_RCMVM|nr:pR43 [rat cytomegalovirus strain Maastricht]AAF99141.1 pR43 [rat cytomegalovirus strain Maastricht]WEG71969.1 tegument protein UL43 [Murid betaherpesvirus 2]